MLFRCLVLILANHGVIDMLINYGSFMYFAYIFIAIGICVGLFFLLRRKSDKTKRIVLLSLAFVNLAQHILKPFIYPHYWGEFSPHLSSAYNVCAFLILTTPFVLLFGNELLKNYMTYIGSIAGMIAMIVPFWFIGQSAFQWEAYRFYLCHSLLFVTSLLPVLLGMHKLRWKHFWKIGLLFLAMLAIILLNDVFFVAINGYAGTNPNDIYESLCLINPCWSVLPPIGKFDWLINIIAFFSPSFLMGGNSSGFYVPILWYAIPMYLGITLVAFGACALIDLKAFKRDFSAFMSKFKRKEEK